MVILTIIAVVLAVAWFVISTDSTDRSKKQAPHDPIEDRAQSPTWPMARSTIAPSGTLKPLTNATGHGALKVARRARVLKGPVTPYGFSLGREDFEDVMVSPNGRWATGVSDGADGTPNVAIIDQSTNSVALVLVFEKRPRYPRVGDTGLLLIEEPYPRGAIVHCIEPDGTLWWSRITLAPRPLVAFSAGDEFVIISLGLWNRSSNDGVETWILRTADGAHVTAFCGTERLRATTDGLLEVALDDGRWAQFITPDGMMSHVLSDAYVEKHR